MMKVSDVMTRRVISVSPEATILEAIKLMLKHHISGLPVIAHRGKLVGIVTESDFLHRPETGTERKRSRWLDSFFGPEAAAKAFARSHGQKVADVMTRDPITVTENAPLDQVVQAMESYNVKRLPVMHRGKVVGIVSRADLMLALASVSRGNPVPTGDAAIRDRIMAAIREQSWTAGALVDVIVRNGVADVWGSISDVAQRNALRVLVASTPGVNARFEDHLTWQGEDRHLAHAALVRSAAPLTAASAA
jgi:CBS domain-containing protein